MRFSCLVLAMPLISTTALAADPPARPTTLAARTTTAPSSTAEALDRPLPEITLQAQSLGAVLEALAQKAGVRFEIADDTYATLPWGRDTRLASVKVAAGASLRTTLDELLKPLGLIYAIGDKSVRIDPSAPLARMNRRATWNDLHFLNWLDTTPCSPENMAKAKFQYRITSKVNAPQLLQDQIKRAGDGTITQILEAATRALGWTWFPDEDHVVILSAQAHIAHNLARTVTARYNQMGLAHILLDLADKADVPLFLEPGLMLKLPPNVAKSYTLLLQQTTVRDALELICAETGLAYKILRDGISIVMSPNAPGAPPARTRGDPYVARILVPARNGIYSYELLIRESEMPQDVIEYRGQIIDEMIERMRQDMAPTPTPESAPAAADDSETPTSKR